MDYRLEQLINGLAGQSPVADQLMVGLAAWSELAFIVLVLAWFMAGIALRLRRDREFALVALLAAGLALLMNQLLGHLWDRPRPFVAHPGLVRLLLPHAADSSFPSDHAAAAFAIAVVMTAVHRRLGAGLLVVSGLIGFARVYAGDHYPGDVLVGSAVGVAAAIVLIRFARPVAAAMATVEAALAKLRRWPPDPGRGPA